MNKIDIEIKYGDLSHRMLDFLQGTENSDGTYNQRDVDWAYKKASGEIVTEELKWE